MARPQDKNLIPNSERSPKELREMTRKGGIASGEARRRKRDMRESFETLFAMQASDKYKNAFRKQGMEVPDNVTNEQILALSMTAKAIAGDARMASLILDVLGEKQSDRLKRKELDFKERQAMDTRNDALDKLDEILRGLHDTAQNDT